MASIFLDKNLPVEGQVEEKEITADSEPFKSSAPDPDGASGRTGISSEDSEEILNRIQENIDLKMDHTLRVNNHFDIISAAIE